jgi:hypothetical protein
MQDVLFSRIACSSCCGVGAGRGLTRVARALPRSLCSKYSAYGSRYARNFVLYSLVQYEVHRTA